MDWRETIESDGGEAICSSGAEKGNEQKGGECLALPTFSRHGKVQVNLTLLIWLIENVALLTLRAWTQMGKEIKG